MDDETTIIYEDLAKRVIDRLDYKFTKELYVQPTSDTTYYDFHVKLDRGKIDLKHLEHFVILELQNRGFQDPLVKAQKKLRIKQRTLIKRLWHTHDGTTCPTYYVTVVCPVIDTFTLITTGTLSLAGKTKRAIVGTYTHRMSITLKQQNLS